MRLYCDTIKQRLTAEAADNAFSCRILSEVKVKVSLERFTKSVPTLSYLELLMNSYDQQTFLMFSHLSKHFQRPSVAQQQFSLAEWMATMCFYPRSCSDKLLELFLQYCEQLVRGSSMATHQVGQTVRFAKLLARRRFCPQLLFTLMDRLPYAREIFLLYLQQCPLEERSKIRHLLSEKELRLVNRD